jgi:hypothetical protein
MSVPEPRSRCFLVYALAPESMSARDANELLNEYIGQSSRGQIVSHDDFIGQPRGALRSWKCETRTRRRSSPTSGPRGLGGHEPAADLLADRGRFVAQSDFTLRNYGGTSLAELEEAEEPRKRFWWQKPKHRG